MTSQKDVRELLNRAKRAGWIYLGFDGGSHHKIQWPATGRIRRIPATPGGGRRSLENAEADLARDSGPLRAKPGTGRTKTERAAARQRRRNVRYTVKPVGAAPLPDWRDKLAALKPQLSQENAA
ncbi:hypothetical protein [Nocardia niwae]|uniref:hypothetical protein n=1 Tax=Nocardia niwae TaxID=626084 RepID=UPI000B05D9DB|nr:hypothetical protein [Nocardia niwae]